MNDIEFCRWESDCFGYGYGSGEEHIIKAMKVFFESFEDGRYDFRALEEELGATATWLLINALCHSPKDRRLRNDCVIEYGSSPRFGWLTEDGKSLRDYMNGKSDEELLAVLDAYDAIDDEIYQVEPKPREIKGGGK